MADTRDQLQRKLQGKIAEFLGQDHTVYNGAVRSIIEQIRRNRWRAVLFGGMLRDLMVYGLSKRPRDVDIVVADTTEDELSRAFAEFISKRTRFGGLHLRCDGRPFDVWALSDTWAFRTLKGSAFVCDFENLPKTTFLNVEAVAADIAPSRSGTWHVYEHGFFQGIAERILEVNLEDNPFPALCVVRALNMTQRLRFAIGPRLAKYLIHYGGLFSGEELAEVQLNHYGSCDHTAGDFEALLYSVSDQHRSGAQRVQLPALIERKEN